MTLHRLFTCSLLSLAVFVSSPAARGFQRAANEPLIGTWSVASANLAGKEAKLSGEQIRITEDQLQLMKAGKTELELNYRLDRSKAPMEVDLAFQLDKGAGPVEMRVRGIFKADDGKITVCLNGDPQGERPQEFKTATRDNRLMVFTLTKAKPAK